MIIGLQLLIMYKEMGHNYDMKIGISLFRLQRNLRYTLLIKKYLGNYMRGYKNILVLVGNNRILSLTEFYQDYVFIRLEPIGHFPCKIFIVLYSKIRNFCSR